MIAKTSRGGYDGKGVWKLASAAEADQPFAGLAAGVQIIAEEFVDFARELSAIVVRAPSGQAAAYPISESVQRNGVCVETVTPAPGLTDRAGGRHPAAGADHRPRARGGRACWPWN